MPRKPHVPQGPQFSPYLEEYIKEFIEHRKDLKKPMTPRAVALFRKKILDELKQLHTEGEIASEIERSILAGWLAIYPKPLPFHERQKRWWNTPELFYDYLTHEERTSYSHLYAG